MFWNKIANQKSFKNSNQKFKKDAEQFPSPVKANSNNQKSNQRPTRKTSIPLPPNKKNTKNVTPLRNVRIQKTLKTHLPHPLPWQQPRLVVVEALGLEDQNLRHFGAPLKGGWWFCRLKKTFKTSPFPGVSPSFFGGLPGRLFVTYWGVLEKNHANHFPELVIYMVWKQAFCKDHLKKTWRIQIQKLNVKWTVEFWENTSNIS